jgi:hypothetical protein
LISFSVDDWVLRESGESQSRDEEICFGEGEKGRGIFEIDKSLKFERDGSK